MSAAALIGEARSSGVTLWHDAGRVRYRGPRTAVMRVLPMLAAYRDDLAEALRLEAQAEAFEERAAIMEYDGGLSRGDAEASAIARLALRYGSCLP